MPSGISKVEFFFPKTTDQNKWADYFEILCLINENESITLDFIVDRIVDEMLGDSIAAFEKIENESKEENGNEEDLLEESDMSELPIGNEKADKEDKLKKKINQHVNFLLSRIKLYGEFYPFYYIKKSKIFKLKTTLNTKHNLYLSLLISSNLDIADTYLSKLTKEFEKLSLYVFKNLLNKCEIHYFGANGIIASRYTGNVFNKFSKLSTDISIPLSHYANKDYLNKNNVGDKGLDLVGWFKFKDQVPGTFLYFGQCACGKNWIDKTLEAHAITWERVFQFFNKPTTIVFIPKSYRNEKGFWFNPFNVHQDFILIDRFRLLNFLPKSNHNTIIKPYKRIISEIISNKMNYFD